MTKEIWKQIKINDFSKYYQISSYGQIKQSQSSYILKQYIVNGYKTAGLYNPESKKRKTIRIHKVVADVFCKKLLNSQVVNHINGNKLDNRSCNLEFTTYKKNTDHAIKMKLTKPYYCPVKQYNKQNKCVNTFRSIKLASKITGLYCTNIIKACKGTYKTCGGFIWKYANNDRIKTHINHKMKQLKQYPNYLITVDGQIYSKYLKKYRRLRKHESGYLAVTLCKDGIYKTFYVHRLMAETYLKPDNSKKYVNHIDGNKSNNKLSNLEFVSQSENMKHYHTIKKQS
jgi:hypothetical protein